MVRMSGLPAAALDISFPAGRVELTDTLIEKAQSTSESIVQPSRPCGSIGDGANVRPPRGRTG